MKFTQHPFILRLKISINCNISILNDIVVLSHVSKAYLLEVSLSWFPVNDHPDGLT